MHGAETNLFKMHLFILKINLFLFIWPSQVLVAAVGDL